MGPDGANMPPDFRALVARFSSGLHSNACLRRTSSWQSWGALAVQAESGAAFA